MDLESDQLPQPYPDQDEVPFQDSFMWMMPQFNAEGFEFLKSNTPDAGHLDSSFFPCDLMYGGAEIPMMPNPMEYWQAFFGQEPTTEAKQFPVMTALPKPVFYPLLKRIGTLSVEERHAKVSRYLEKRKRRCFSKKVSYDCRKKVADNRVRVKGRFISKQQAESLTSQVVKPEKGQAKQ
jgi:hypothetical protein